MSDALFDFTEASTGCPHCGRHLNEGRCTWCDKPLPLTPYAGTSGWSGSDTSKARAVESDRDGTTSERQAITLKMLRLSLSRGVTVAELRDATGWHHGQASGVLSVLHKEGLIARLSESRLRCKVYTLPEYVIGRVTEPHGRKKHVPASPDGPVPVHSCDDTEFSQRVCPGCLAERAK